MDGPVLSSYALHILRGWIVCVGLCPSAYVGLHNVSCILYGGLYLYGNNTALYTKTVVVQVIY